MRNKKDEPAEPTPEQLLEAKVDAMMDPKPGTEPAKAGNTKSSKTKTTEPGASLPPLDIFSDPATAPEVPKDLLKRLGGSKTNSAAEEAESATTPPSADSGDAVLDDPATDAAVDDIVAHESDEALAIEDTEQQEAEAQTEPVERVRKLHHHPVFWACIFLLALLAIILAYLFATGGNAKVPGGAAVQKLVDRLQNN